MTFFGISFCMILKEKTAFVPNKTFQWGRNIGQGVRQLCRKRWFWVFVSNDARQSWTRWKRSNRWMHFKELFSPPEHPCRIIESEFRSSCSLLWNHEALRYFFSQNGSKKCNQSTIVIHPDKMEFGSWKGKHPNVKIVEPVLSRGCDLVYRDLCLIVARNREWIVRSIHDNLKKQWSYASSDSKINLFWIHQSIPFENHVKFIQRYQFSE